jgi:hypothetical protein
VDAEPPRLEQILANTTSQPNEMLANLVAIKPEIPVGPSDVLKGYEQDIILVAQRLSAEMANISQARQADQVTREQAEYLIQEKHQFAMMQFQTLSSAMMFWNTMWLRQQPTAKGPDRARERDTAVVVELPSA